MRGRVCTWHIGFSAVHHIKQRHSSTQTTVAVCDRSVVPCPVCYFCFGGVLAGGEKRRRPNQVTTSKRLGKQLIDLGHTRRACSHAYSVAQATIMRVSELGSREN